MAHLGFRGLLWLLRLAMVLHFGFLDQEPVAAKAVLPDKSLNNQTPESCSTSSQSLSPQILDPELALHPRYGCYYTSCMTLAYGDSMIPKEQYIEELCGRLVSVIRWILNFPIHRITQSLA